jgi:hypothetical protein
LQITRRPQVTGRSAAFKYNGSIQTDSRIGACNSHRIRTYVTVTVSIAEQRFALVAVTVYTVVEAGDIVKLEPEKFPGVQEYREPPLAVKVVKAWRQIAVSGPANATGFGFTVILTMSLSVHPFVSVTVTV